MPKVNSTAIASVRPSIGGVVVRFHNGGRYRYDGVPFRTYRRLRRSESVGVTYNREVKGQYPSTKLN